MCDMEGCWFLSQVLSWLECSFVFWNLISTCSMLAWCFGLTDITAGVDMCSTLSRVLYQFLLHRPTLYNFHSSTIRVFIYLKDCPQGLQ